MRDEGIPWLSSWNGERWALCYGMTVDNQNEKKPLYFVAMPPAGMPAVIFKRSLRPLVKYGSLEVLEMPGHFGQGVYSPRRAIQYLRNRIQPLAAMGNDVILVGACMSAWVAMKVSLQSSVKGLLIVNPLLTWRPWVRDFLAFWVRHPGSPTMAVLRFLENVLGDQAKVDYQDLKFGALPIGAVHRWELVHDVLKDVARGYRIPSIPVLSLAGADDKVLAGKLGHFPVIVIPGNHWCLKGAEEHLERFTNEVAGVTSPLAVAHGGPSLATRIIDKMGKTSVGKLQRDIGSL
jgi:hypothetical protein